MPTVANHGLRSSASHVLTATGFVMAIFDPPTETTLLKTDNHIMTARSTVQFELSDSKT